MVPDSASSSLSIPQSSTAPLSKEAQPANRPESNSEIIAAFQKCLVSLMNDGVTVYLEGLGFLLHSEKEKIVRRVHRESFYLIHQTQQKIEFEKCDDTTGISFEELSQVVDTNGLAELIIKSGISLAAPKLRMSIRAIIRSIKIELLQTGFSKKLGSVGTLVAIGDFSRERGGFPQIDIILVSSSPHTITNFKDGPYIRPLLNNGYELLTAAFGEPATSTTVFLREFLGEDYDGSFTVAAFHIRGANPRLFLASEGLKTFGAECVIEVPLKPGEEPVIPGWALQIMAIGWYALQTIKARKLIRGVVIDSGSEILPGINHILIHERSGLRDRHLSPEGEFMYLSLCGVTNEEAEFAKITNTEYLIQSLYHKGLRGLTKLNRHSLWRGLKFPQDNSTH